MRIDADRRQSLLRVREKLERSQSNQSHEDFGEIIDIALADVGIIVAQISASFKNHESVFLQSRRRACLQDAKMDSRGLVM